MAEQGKYAYTTVPGKLRDLMQKIPKIGRPDKVTGGWLKTAGWTSSNDASMITVLKFVGLIGADGRPTEVWDAVRTGNKTQFSEAVKTAYADLFSLYPDAHRKDAESLRNFFRPHTAGGEQVQAKMVQTFQILVEFGAFDSSPSAEKHNSDGADLQSNAMQQKSSGETHKLSTNSIALTVNIQLQLPATADGSVYESLFAAMRKHLIELIGQSE